MSGPGSAAVPFAGGRKDSGTTTAVSFLCQRGWRDLDLAKQWNIRQGWLQLTWAGVAAALLATSLGPPSTAPNPSRVGGRVAGLLCRNSRCPELPNAFAKKRRI